MEVSQRLVPNSAEIPLIITQTKQLLDATFSPQQIQAFEADQAKREQELAAVISPCPAPLVNVGAQIDSVTELDPLRYRLLLREEFYDAALMQALQCILGIILYAPPGSLQRIRRVLGLERRIGAESVEGFAFLSTLRDASAAFIIKAPQRMQGSVGILHEYIVGAAGTNRLRSRIPNFSYIFGYFQCLPPIVDQEKSVATWCTGADGSAVSYVIYENVTNAVSFQEYVKTCTPRQFLQMYVQALLALRLGVIEIDFTHYDLHFENVLIRQIQRTGTDALEEAEFYIRYDTPWGPRYLLSNRIATFIDYGFAHIRVGNQSFGHYEFMENGIRPNRSYPIYDAYKLLGFTMYAMLTNNNVPAFQVAAQILAFFNQQETAQQIIISQRNTLYSLPLTAGTEMIGLDDLLNHIANFTDISFLHQAPAAGVRVLGCEGTDICLSAEETIASIQTPPQISDLVDLYDVVQGGQQLELIQDQLLQLAQVTTQKAIVLQTQVDELLQSLQAFPYTDIQQLFTSFQTIAAYRAFITGIARAYDILYQINFYNTALAYFGYEELDISLEEAAMDGLLARIGNLNAALRAIPAQQRQLLPQDPDSRWIFSSANSVANLPFFTNTTGTAVQYPLVATPVVTVM